VAPIDIKAPLLLIPTSATFTMRQGAGV